MNIALPVRSLIAGVAVGLVIALAPSCGPTGACSASNCQGCCNTAGQCESGLGANACGTAGVTCVACPSNQTCNSGRCEASSGSTGGGSGGAGGGTGGSAAFTQWCGSYAAAYCDGLIGCGYMESSARTACVNYFVNSDCFEAGPSIAKGYSTFDTQAAAACLSQLQLALGECYLGVSGCGNLAKPASANGAGCFGSGDCVDSNAGCAGSSACSRTCAPAGGLNQPCTSTGRCNTGLFCDSTETCKAPGPAGSDCTSSSMCDSSSTCDFNSMKCVALPTGGQPCTSQYRCAANAYCDFNVTPYTCRLAAQIGQPCSTTQCTSDAYCDFTPATPVCAAKKAGGSSCTSSTQCTSNRCEGNICRTPAGAGSPCQSFSDCESSLDCDSVTRTCSAYRYDVPTGGSCTNDSSRCAYPNVCKGYAANPDGGVGTSGSCAAPAIGDSCQSHFSCPKSAYCAGADAGTLGTCTAASLGTGCSSSFNCQAAHYCEETGTGISCAPRIALNQPCNPSSEDNPCVKPNHCVPTSDTTAVCKPLGTAGSSCFPNAPGNNNECTLLHQCVNNLCQPAGLAGQPCLNGQCLEGACLGRDGGVGGTCGPAKADGTACSPSGTGECSGFCDSISYTCATCN